MQAYKPIELSYLCVNPAYKFIIYIIQDEVRDKERRAEGKHRSRKSDV